MLNFILGALAMLAAVTFLPPRYAAKPSEWLRAGLSWAWSRWREVKRRGGD